VTGFESGSALTSIEEQAFVVCGELKSIVLPACPSELSERAFLLSGIRNISVISIEEENAKLAIAGICIGNQSADSGN
jgi:hypothetical protein